MMKKYARCLLATVPFLLVLGTTIPATAICQTNCEKINRLIDQYHEIGQFNGCIMVVENGQVIYRNALGFADTGKDQILTLDHGFRLASVSKQFTAMAAMILKEQGKLAYSDDISLYIPRFPYSDVTIQHLLTHTSGLPDYGQLVDENWDTTHKGSAERKVVSNRDVLKLLIEKQPPIEFNPGSRFEYSNTGYMLLALVIEWISGKRFQDFMKERIFLPIGMNDTYVNEPSGVLKDNKRAYGLKPDPEGSGFVLDDHDFQNGMYGDGGIISTVNDLFKWDKVLYTENLVSQSTINEAFSPARLNDSSTVDYGFGWSLIPNDNGMIVAHGGGWLGFRSFILRDTSARNTIIQLCNAPGIRRGELAFAINDILQGKPYKFPVAEKVTFQVDMRIPMKHQIFQPSNQDIIIVRGEFNGWQSNDLVLTDTDCDSIYSLISELVAFKSDTLEYKFLIYKNDGQVIWEQNPKADNPPYGNRRLTLTGKPQTLPVVVFDIDQYLLDGQVKFGAESLREDFLQLRKTIEGLHPGLYEFTHRTTFDSLFQRKYDLIDGPMSGVEFYQLVSPLVAAIGCGHSTISMPESWWRNQPDRYFPLKMHFIDNSAYVMESYLDTTKIVVGSRVDSINGVPISRIISNLLSAISADGFNSSYRSERLNRRFNHLYALHFGFPDRFQLTYVKPGSEQDHSIYLEPVSAVSLVMSDPWMPVREFRIIEEKKAALLRLNHFNYYNELAEFQSFLDESFEKIHASNIGNLILDLRDNYGGDPFSAAYLLSYIASKPVPYFAKEYGRYARLARPIEPADQRFKGRLFALINGSCFSTTGHLSALLRYHDFGIFIGSETGGTYTCNDAKVTIPLRNTNIQLQVAQGSFAAAVTNMVKDRGIIPDIPIQPTIDNLIIGKDGVLEHTLDLIEKRSSSGSK